MKQITSMTVDDLRVVSIKCRSEWDVLDRICGKQNTHSLYAFRKNFEMIQSEIRKKYPNTLKVCIPLANNRHTTLGNLLMIASAMRINSISVYGMCAVGKVRRKL